MKFLETRKKNYNNKTKIDNDGIEAESVKQETIGLEVFGGCEKICYKVRYFRFTNSESYLTIFNMAT
ncbi:hypothetical protein HHI36_003180 [Cryptolaemus montrouzieri]|uniref:Uncharacterized protein n=1 Tax=Cryptolaemus montrouzieri TaxID=559131 RepID=A0ABD2PD61_9CUCU